MQSPSPTGLVTHTNSNVHLCGDTVVRGMWAQHSSELSPSLHLPLMSNNYMKVAYFLMTPGYGGQFWERARVSTMAESRTAVFLL